MGAITNDFLAAIDMARSQRAALGLEDGTLCVVLNGQDEGAVWGQVTNGDSKAYSVQVAHGYASCSCPDWAYRHRDGLEACKHALALAFTAAKQQSRGDERVLITNHETTLAITLRHPTFGVDRFGFRYTWLDYGFWHEHGCGRLWQEVEKGWESRHSLSPSRPG